MERFTQHLRQLTYKLFPTLAQQPANLQELAHVAMTFFYFMLPAFAVGLVWLWLITDWSIIADNWAIFLFLLLLVSAIDKRPFQIPISLSEQFTIPLSASLSNLISVAVLLIFGPSALWIFIIEAVGEAIQTLWRNHQQNLPHQFTLNNFVQASGVSTFQLLVAGLIFTASGGSYPFQATRFADWLPAIWSILALSAAPLFLYLLPVWSITLQTRQRLNKQSFFQLIGGSILL
ncbi:MAG: hypothetical protein KC445_18790, partial [Anaerolineales bacterium]|nr:hypothetical protein [Anaerolineales bacterium]